MNAQELEAARRSIRRNIKALRAINAEEDAHPLPPTTNPAAERLFLGGTKIENRAAERAPRDRFIAHAEDTLKQL